MSTVTPERIASLIDSGERIMCPSCRAVIRPAKTCRFCGNSTEKPAPKADEKPATKKKTPTRVSRYPKAQRGKIGSLAELPHQELIIVMYGNPISQGSMNAVAPGVMRHTKSEELDAWRDGITREALRACGPTWVPCDTAVEVSATFTVPAPKKAPTKPTPVGGYRDLDKLQRAVGDALCPSDTTRFRVYASDMRISRWYPTKSYPRPICTDVDALDKPGVVLRIRPATSDIDTAHLPPLPTTTKRSDR